MCEYQKVSVKAVLTDACQSGRHVGVDLRVKGFVFQVNFALNRSSRYNALWRGTVQGRGAWGRGRGRGRGVAVVCYILILCCVFLLKKYRMQNVVECFGTSGSVHLGVFV